MTIAASDRSVKYVGNNTTATYAYTFPITSSSELEVRSVVRSTGVETVLALTTDYTVTGAGGTSGGNVVLVAGNLASTADLIISGVTPTTQGTDIRNQEDFYPRVHEAVFDKLTKITQEHSEQLERAVKIPRFNAGAFDATVGSLVGKGGYYFKLNSGLTGLELASPPSNGTNGADGADGSVWTSGAGAPSGGADGDFYLNTANGDVYSRLAGVWSVVDNITGPTGATGSAGAAGPGVPTGGTAGQVLEKINGTDYNTQWATPAVALPTGGTANQVLVKQSGVDGDAAWEDPAASAAAITFTPAGSIAATDVQAAIVELDGDIALKAPLASPTFTGNPAGPTPAAGDNDTSLATTAFVVTAIGEKRPAPTNFSATSVAPTARAMDETFVFNGGASVTMTATPLGALAGVTNGYRARFIGTSDEFFPTFNESDAADGILLSGPAELLRGRILDVEYNSTIGRVVESSRNF